MFLCKVRFLFFLFPSWILYVFGWKYVCPALHPLDVGKASPSLYGNCRLQLLALSAPDSAIHLRSPFRIRSSVSHEPDWNRRCMIMPWWRTGDVMGFRSLVHWVGYPECAVVKKKKGAQLRGMSMYSLFQLRYIGAWHEPGYIPPFLWMSLDQRGWRALGEGVAMTEAV